ncbi:helix-turn-helix domain-containing protein [Variovorax humicola]|uniref:Helix-turn-helix domain-containing protein n=1 Tax=Variovorax humicola TaxID=1769758 RepID=A0ABU8VVX9_9BURK
MSITLSTDTVPAAQQLDYWTEAICGVFMHLDVEPPQDGRQGFDGRIVQHAEGKLDLAEVLVEGHAVLRTNRQLHRDSEDSFFVMVQRDGESWIEQDGREGWMRKGEFVLLDGGRSYTMRFPHRIHHEVLKVPGNVLRASIRDPQRFTSCPISGASGAGRIFLGVLETLHDTAGDLDHGSAAGVADALVDLLSATIGTMSQAHVKVPSHLEQYHRHRVQALVQERMFDPELSIDSVAAAVKLSPRYLHRLFEDEKLTLSGWIWHERLEAARRALLSPAAANRSLTDIAYAVGFKDPAHFSRMFKATYGSSPRAFRLEIATNQSA